MISLKNDCDIFDVSEENAISDFDCGNEDLNEFFNRDAIVFLVGSR